MSRPRSRRGCLATFTGLELVPDCGLFWRLGSPQTLNSERGAMPSALTRARPLVGGHRLGRRRYCLVVGLREFGNNLGTIAPKHRGKEGSRANQKTRRVNKIATHGPVCKTSIPGSNPGGASKFTKKICRLTSRRPSVAARSVLKCSQERLGIRGRQSLTGCSSRLCDEALFERDGGSENLHPSMPRVVCLSF